MESGEHRQLACSRRQLADNNRVRQAAEHRKLAACAPRKKDDGSYRSSTRGAVDGDHGLRRKSAATISSR